MFHSPRATRASDWLYTEGDHLRRGLFYRKRQFIEIQHPRAIKCSVSRVMVDAGFVTPVDIMLCVEPSFSLSYRSSPVASARVDHILSSSLQSEATYASREHIPMNP